MDDKPRTLRKFLAIFILPTPQKEHARLVDAVAYHSDGDYTLAFRQGMKDGAVIAYFMTSASNPWEMGFGQVLLNQDKHLILELSERHWLDRMNVAEAWLKAHRRKDD